MWMKLVMLMYGLGRSATLLLLLQSKYVLATTYRYTDMMLCDCEIYCCFL